ncbi:MAG: hypothetical protein M1839_007600 [Geoglossum umbratile]|nr:MAG: hypothetical protein M1839_007600 [Geoglossum umbratile]
MKELFDRDHFGNDLYRFRTSLRALSKSLLVRQQEKAKILKEVGEVVTGRAPLLEAFCGDDDILSSSLSKWVTRLPRLRCLELWRGDALKGVEEVIRENCPFFRSLSIYEWLSLESDLMLATFLAGLRPQTLESFEVISKAGIGCDTLLALNTRHQMSLKELKLSDANLTALPMLKDCVALESLYLDAGFTDHGLEGPFISGIATWLRGCKKLQNVSLVRMRHSSEIVKPVLLENDIKLLKLELEGYKIANSKELYQALTNHTSLRSLKLKGDGSDASRADVDILVECLAKLTNLRDLQLRDVSDNFDDADICRLVCDLNELQVFWTSGYGISDEVLPALVKPKLRSLLFNAMTVFTIEGIQNFIWSLDPEQNKGLALSVLNADPDSYLTDIEQGLICTSMMEKVGGWFEFFLNRDIDSDLSLSD